VKARQPSRTLKGADNDMRRIFTLIALCAALVPGTAHTQTDASNRTCGL
jgi:hypothetical protein